MNVFVMVDMEGISGICKPVAGHRRGRATTRPAGKLLTMDVNACVEGCVAGGAKKIVVRDAHWQRLQLPLGRPRPARRVHPGQLRPPAHARHRRLRRPDPAGLPRHGRHARGDPRAHDVLRGLAELLHQRRQERRTGHRRRHRRRPRRADACMVSGDDKCLQGGRRSSSRTSSPSRSRRASTSKAASCCSLDVAHQLIREGAEQACREYKRFKPYKVKKPVTMRLELVSRGKVPVHRPGREGHRRPHLRGHGPHRRAGAEDAMSDVPVLDLRDVTWLADDRVDPRCDHLADRPGASTGRSSAPTAPARPRC